MSVLHRDGASGKTVAFGESHYFGGMVISHQEISQQVVAYVKKALMVDLRVRIETTACALAACGVWRVYKEDSIFVIAVFSQCGERIALLDAA